MDQPKEAMKILESLVAPKSVLSLKTNRPKVVEKLTPSINKKILDRSQKTKQKKTLTRKEFTALGLYALPNGCVKYMDVVPLHKLWKGYLARHLEKEKLADVGSPQHSQLILDLLKADFHGAKVTVARSKNPSVIGINGIILLDTKGTFKIIGKDDIIRTIPKNDSVFVIHWNHVDITVFGKQLNTRPAERSVKKLKTFMEPDLD